MCAEFYCLAVALAAFAALTAGAAAQVTSAQQSAIRSNCRSDFMSKCSGVTPGGKDALMCLQKNVDSLSGGCQTAVRATMPAEPKMAAPLTAAPPPAAATEPSAPPPAAAEKPATIVSAPPPRAKPAKRPIPHPATAAVAPPPAAPAPPPPVAAPPAEGMVPGGMLVEKACARFILMHCRGMGFGTAPKVACLVKYVNEGNFVAPRCHAALKVTGQLR